MPIQMHPVDSSAVSHVGYDPESKTMRIRFATGAVYQYPAVDPEEHQALLASSSLGRHLNQHFRSRGTRVSE